MKIIPDALIKKLAKKATQKYAQLIGAEAADFLRYFPQQVHALATKDEQLWFQNQRASYRSTIKWKIYNAFLELTYS